VLHIETKFIKAVFTLLVGINL